MRSISFHCAKTAALAVSLLAPAALPAHALAGAEEEEHFDVLLFGDPVSGRVKTGAVNEAGDETLSTNLRVFGGELGEADPGDPNFGDEPGFRAFSGAFDTSGEWGFNILGPLALWDGADFDTASPHTMTVQFGPDISPIGAATTADGFVDGFSLPVDGDGGVHDHLDFLLNAPDDSPAHNGIYLLTLELYATDFDPSAPVFFVFNRGMDETAHDAAIDYVATVLVPAPPAGAVCAIGLLLARRRRTPAAE